MNRIITLDYLRGLAAFGIMLFHYFERGASEFGANDFWGRVGVYGVTIFYVLSGLTLYHVYYGKMNLTFSDIKNFYIKRFFRIYPLLWLAILLTVVVYMRFNVYSVQTLFLNFTGLFGIFDWVNGIAFGSWSIGNELVFYLFFPLFIFSHKYNKFLFYTLWAATLAVFIYFTFFVFPSCTDDDARWYQYVNPLNQLLYFLGGFSIGAFFHSQKLNPFVCIAILLICLVAFISIDVENPVQHALYTGWYRVVFTAICFFICFSLYKLYLPLPAIISWPLKTLGEISFSVYLLHNTLLKVVKVIFLKINLPLYTNVFIGVCIVTTLLLSYCSYHFMERYFMKLGNKLIYKTEK